jgi:hypothetical protein
MEEQYDFHSTAACNIVFINFILESFQVGHRVEVFYNYFNTDFDSVNQCILIKILKKIWIMRTTFNLV